MPLFKGADENRGYKDLLAHFITSICILVTFIFVLFVITPSVMRAKGFEVTTGMLAIAANLAPLISLNHDSFWCLRGHL